ncbi:hypothetical protein [Salinispora arenicola]|uniref:hypothetical protein n=1 Tax=Salinispora arenicola TaxID=168697 RepID=UPI0022A86EF3|nr:hypothetical protein [Salinispora arenicola]
MFMVCSDGLKGMTDAIRSRRQSPDQATHWQATARSRQPRLQPATTRTALTGRTGLRDPDRTLENPPAHHRQPTPDQRHRRRRTSSDPLRVQVPTAKSLRLLQ